MIIKNREMENMVPDATTHNAMVANSVDLSNNNLLPLQVPQPSQSSLLYQRIVEDPNNHQAIKEMEEETALWVIRFIFTFISALQLYINLYHSLPLELLFASPALLDCLLVWYYARRSRSGSYSLRSP